MPKGIYSRKTKEGKYGVGTLHLCAGREIIILEKLPREFGKQPRAVIRFTKTGYVANVQLSNIPTGKVKDRREPSVYGVGYIGSDISIPSRYTSEVRRTYDLWANMLKRCYHTMEGGTVDPRWHNFTTFLNTISDVAGYSSWLKDPTMHLDKDTLVPGNKLYSRDTCAFISAFENVRDSAQRRWGKK